MVFESRTPCAAVGSGFAAKTRRAAAQYPQSTTIHRTSLWYSNPARLVLRIVQALRLNPQGRRPVSAKHNNPQDKPVVFESRTPCAAVRSGFAAKPAGPPPSIRKAQQSTCCSARLRSDNSVESSIRIAQVLVLSGPSTHPDKRSMATWFGSRSGSSSMERSKLRPV